MDDYRTLITDVPRADAGREVALERLETLAATERLPGVYYPAPGHPLNERTYEPTDVLDDLPSEKYGRLDEPGEPADDRQSTLSIDALLDLGADGPEGGLAGDSTPPEGVTYGSPVVYDVMATFLARSSYEIDEPQDAPLQSEKVTSSRTPTIDGAPYLIAVAYHEPSEAEKRERFDTT